MVMLWSRPSRLMRCCLPSMRQPPSSALRTSTGGAPHCSRGMGWVVLVAAEVSEGRKRTLSSSGMQRFMAIGSIPPAATETSIRTYVRTLSPLVGEEEKQSNPLRQKPAVYDDGFSCRVTGGRADQINRGAGEFVGLA